MARQGPTSMTRRGIAIGIALVLASCGEPGPQVVTGKSRKPPFVGAPPVEPTVTREIRAELQGLDFDRLEARFAGLQSSWESNPRNDAPLLVAWWVFGVPEESHGKLYDLWNEAKPDSAFAHTARGWYRMMLASAKRGAKWASETAASQMQAYDELNALARADLKEALHLQPKCIGAIWALASIEQLSREDRRKLYEDGLALDPASSILRYSYLRLLQPKWGGSLEEIDEVVQGTKPHLSANPDLAGIAGYPAYVEADGYYVGGDYQRAEEAYSRAVSAGPSARYLRARAEVRNRLGKFHEAIGDCDRALELAPEDFEPSRYAPPPT